MHPLQSLNETDLVSLAKVADRLLSNRRLLAPGQRSNRLRAGTGIEFLDHREYAPGDDIRAVDWRASARSRHPQLKRYSDEAATDWFLLVDCSSSMAFGRGGKWALAVQCAAAMAYLLIHLGNRVSILLFTDRIERMIPLGRGYAHYAGILKSLRQATAAGAGRGSSLRCCLSKIKRNSPVFVISDFLTADAMRDELDALCLRGDRLHSLQILCAQDSRLPAGQAVCFRDVESGAMLSAHIGAAQRNDYRHAFDEFNDSLAQYCRKKHIHFSRHSDADPWKSVLTRHLKNAGSMR